MNTKDLSGHMDKIIAAIDDGKACDIKSTRALCCAIKVLCSHVETLTTKQACQESMQRIIEKLEKRTGYLEEFNNLFGGR